MAFESCSAVCSLCCGQLQIYCWCMDIWWFCLRLDPPQKLCVFCVFFNVLSIILSLTALGFDKRSRQHAYRPSLLSGSLTTPLLHTTNPHSHTKHPRLSPHTSTTTTTSSSPPHPHALKWASCYGNPIQQYVISLSEFKAGSISDDVTASREALKPESWFFFHLAARFVCVCLCVCG